MLNFKIKYLKEGGSFYCKHLWNCHLLTLLDLGLPFILAGIIRTDLRTIVNILWDKKKSSEYACFICQKPSVAE